MSTTFGRSSTYVPMKSYGAAAARAWSSGTRRTPLSPARRSSLARAAMTPVASVSAGAAGVGGGGAAVRRVVLEAAVPRRVVRRGDDDAVGEAGGLPAVRREDRVADGGS